jgi:hypothetical protein
MKPDDFEQQLQNQPLRPAPAGWRAEILRQAAGADAKSQREVAECEMRNTECEPERLGSAPAPSGWLEWLWPCPQAWAALAAIWILLLGLHLTHPPSLSSPITQTRPPTPEARMALAAQRREMTRLLDGPVEPPSAPKPAVPGPRSERMPPSKA